MTPSYVSGGFLPMMLLETTTQPQQFQVENGYLYVLNQQRSNESLYNSCQSFFQPTARPYASRNQNFFLNNTNKASSSNSYPLNTSVGSGISNAGTNVGWGSLITNPNEWLDFSRSFDQST